MSDRKLPAFAILAMFVALTACQRAESPVAQAPQAETPATRSEANAAPAPSPQPVEEVRPPACFDARTLTVVRDIIREQFLPGNAYRQMSKAVFDERVSIENALPVKWDKDIMRYECTAMVVVDSSRGLDAAGSFVVETPQLLAAAGSSVAELERVIASDLSADRKKFSYAISYISQRAGDKVHVALADITQLRSFLTGSFVAAHLKQAASSPPPVKQKESTVFEKCMEAASSNGMQATCIGAELEVQQARVSASLEEALEKRTDDGKVFLGNEQKAWMERRDVKCGDYNDPQLASMERVEKLTCRLEETKNRAIALGGR